VNRPPASRQPAAGFDASLLPLWLLVLLMPLVFAPAMQNNFRVPKLLASEVLAAFSLVTLAWRLRTRGAVDLGVLWRRPVVGACALLLAAASLGLITSAHTVFVRPAVASLALALVATVVWEAALDRAEARRLIIALVVPGGMLALVAVLQNHGLYQPFPLETASASRLSLTSLAGSPFDLATFLVFPILIAQGALARADLGRRRWAWAALLALCLYAVALTQTLSAVLAIGLGSVCLWLQVAARRRLLALAAAAAVSAAALLAVARPLRLRVEQKLEQVRGGDLNDALTGRLDGWRTAWWMFERRPITGVGQGAFRAEFAAARLALVERGVRFYRSQQQPFFENPHSDLLAVAAGWGLIGVLALLGALALFARAGICAWRALRAGDRSQRVDAAVASAIVVATALETTATFPLHLALIAYPFLLLVAAVFRAGRALAPVAAAEVSEAV